MKEYILQETAGGLQLLTKDALPVSLTEILSIYPDKRVYALRGQMGAGKTTFVKALCEAIGVEDVVNSPTFAIVNVYEIGNKDIVSEQTREIYHFDCYRLKSVQEALDFGAEEYLYSGNYCFIEWPDMIEPLLPEETVEIVFTVSDNGKRLLTIN